MFSDISFPPALSLPLFLFAIEEETVEHNATKANYIAPKLSPIPSVTTTLHHLPRMEALGCFVSNFHLVSLHKLKEN